jgi:hypothetical protein
VCLAGFKPTIPMFEKWKTVGSHRRRRTFFYIQWNFSNSDFTKSEFKIIRTTIFLPITTFMFTLPLHKYYKADVRT